MTQLFKDDAENKLFYSIMQKAKDRILIQDLILMNKDIIGSKALGYVLYDSNVLDVGFEIDREFFATHYVSIFEAMAANGVRESWITLIKALLGEKTEITFEIPNPGHLRINIKEDIENSTYGLVFETDKPIGALAQTAGLNSGIIMRTVGSNYTINQARNVLENLAVDGVFTEFNLVS
ncbi:hypothetical protein IHC92_20805 [Photobacterium damselae subsp. damselae]|uniref:hypothetical protein n=1 Tax=Photobacterium damselae TaxID=38293 RepID=UPI001F2CA225|nr:hypothetical protein [Photobacterium damselae]UKA23395.1 hypothetical protein IHC92_20805 [Photobacterium damselae subsp. damselae]